MSDRYDPLNPIDLLVEAPIAETTSRDQSDMLEKFQNMHAQWFKELTWGFGLENTPVPETRQKIAKYRAHAEILLEQLNEMTHSPVLQPVLAREYSKKFQNKCEYNPYEPWRQTEKTSATSNTTEHPQSTWGRFLSKLKKL